MNLRPSILGLVTAAALLSLAASPARAMSPQDAKCRNNIAIGARKLVRTLINEQARCHHQRMLGKIPIITDCNDPDFLPGALKIVKAQQKLTAQVTRSCVGAWPCSCTHAPPPAVA